MPNLRAGRQTRHIPATIQTRNEGTEPVIACYFAVFNSPTELLPGCIEQIAPGAFSSSMGNDVRALIDHDTRLVLGRTSANTLTLREDENGLYGEIKINSQDSDAMNLYARVQRGDVTQCSFCFDTDEIEYQTQPDGSVLDVIKRVTLYEVSVVTFPAYAETSAVARSLRDASRQKEHLKRWKQRLKRRMNHGTENPDETEKAE